MSRWKRRAEELESLQRVVSSPGSAFDSSTSETDPSVRTDPAETLDPSTPGGMTPLALAEQSASPPQDKKDGGRWVEGEREGSASALRQELCEAKETVAMMAEELAAAALAVHEEAAKRVAAEDRVESLQVSREGDAEWSRKSELCVSAFVGVVVFRLGIVLPPPCTFTGKISIVKSYRQHEQMKSERTRPEGSVDLSRKRYGVKQRRVRKASRGCGSGHVLK